MEIHVIRSKRRKKTASAKVENGVVILRVPAAISEAELRRVKEDILAQLAKKRRRIPASDEDLDNRAKSLNRRYFGGELRWESIRWVTNQNKRVGSCTPERGTIRISHRLAQMPVFVLEYVIVHELAHLVEANHSARFRELVDRYPRAERARGYLMAIGAEPVEE